VDLEREALGDEESEYEVDRGDRGSRRNSPAHRADAGAHGHRRHGEGDRVAGERSERGRDADHRRDAELPPEPGSRGRIERDETGDGRSDGDRPGGGCLELELDQRCDPNGSRNEQPAPKRGQRMPPKPPTVRYHPDGDAS